MNELATLSLHVTEPSAVAFEQNTRVSSLSVFSDNQWNFSTRWRSFIVEVSQGDSLEVCHDRTTALT